MPRAQPLLTALALQLCLGAALAQTSGLDARPANATCLAPPRPQGAGSVEAVDAFPAAPDFVEPLKLLQAPGDGSRWFVVEKAGRVRTFATADPAATTTWLDLRPRIASQEDGGLLGMAFHPDFPAVPEVFVSYTAPGAPFVSTISRLVLDDVAAPQTFVEDVLLTVTQPYTNHNGGDIAFGPDRNLYIGFGDGGNGGDPQNHAQDNTDLLGAMLRIAVLGVPATERYRIPADNPFAANPRCGPAGNALPCPEIYAFGLRNPWRWSFDTATGALWAADVGQGNREEIELIERGGNFGWRCREGTLAYNGAGCPAGGLVDPVFEYDHSLGTSITGGFVYRGTAIPELRGRYVFGDFAAGWVAALRDDGTGHYTREELVDEGHLVAGFGQDLQGEVYYADLGDGRLYRLAPGGGSDSDAVPVDLADTGCVSPADPTQPAAGLVPYDLNAPFWSDGAAKERWMALPDGTTIDRDAAEDWQFPPRTVLMKNFRLGGQLVETRLFMRHPDGVWRGYTYEWNDAQTAATRVFGGKTKLVQGQPWTYPGEGQCLQCHTEAAGFALGPETAQLNRSFHYVATGRDADQLETLQAIGMFTAPLPPAASRPRLADPADAGAPLHQRARAWLHANCANCHRPGGLTPVNMDLRHAQPLQSLNTCDVAPVSGDLGIPGALRIAAGDAAHSVLASRIARRDAAGMPPLASALVDDAGAALVSSWIDGLGSCVDTDTDGVDDARDNCSAVPNARQTDTDADGFGNACDADFDDSGLVNTVDLALFRAVLGTEDARADLNDDGQVDFADLARFRQYYGQPPGPGAVVP